jgi:hypothetical protein
VDRDEATDPLGLGADISDHVLARPIRRAGREAPLHRARDTVAATAQLADRLRRSIQRVESAVHERRRRLRREVSGCVRRRLADPARAPLPCLASGGSRNGAGAARGRASELAPADFGPGELGGRCDRSAGTPGGDGISSTAASTRSTSSSGSGT